MLEPYTSVLTALRDGTGYVAVDVRAPRDAETKQCFASMWESVERRPQGEPRSRLSVTPEQARELLAAGAQWHGPSHLRAELLPGA